VEHRKPVTALSDRELLEEATGLVRELRDTLAEFEPLLRLVRGTNGSGPSYVQAAGMRRAIKRGRADGHRTE
jgi:RecG-like helicase